MNIKVQLCGVILLTVIFYFYLSRRKIKLKTSLAFLRLCTVTLINLILDILSIVVLYYRSYYPETEVDLICKSYVSSLIVLGWSTFLYICTDIDLRGRQMRIMRHASGFMTVLGVALVYILPIYKTPENFDSAYTYGPSVICTYAFAALLLVFVVTLLIVKRREIDYRRRTAVWFWMIIWVAAAGTQFAFNELLLVGFAGSIGVLIVFLKLENPELNTDVSTGMFNHQGMLFYIDQFVKSGDEFSLIDVVLPVSLMEEPESEEFSIVRIEIIDTLNSISGAYSFLYKEDEAVIVFNEREKAEICLDELKERFKKGWGKLGNTTIAPKWIFMPDGGITEKSRDICHLLEYAKYSGKTYSDSDTIIIDTDMIDVMYEENDMESLIMEALEQDKKEDSGSIEVFYQPIYSTDEKRFTAAEALVRIRDRFGRIVPPEDFVGIAEKNGSILKLGEIVFEDVCRFLRDKNPEQYGLQYIEVNLSAVQCSCESLAERFIEIMRQYGIPSSRINLEITESASVEEKKVLQDNMKKLLDFGVTFSLDDFGTGQSNLNYIVEMPVDIVKFDRSMIMSYFENGKAKYVMDAAMRMIHGLKLHIVSEGIETKEQFDVMNGLGINYIQGYYFSKPLCEQDFLDFLIKNS